MPAKSIGPELPPGLKRPAPSDEDERAANANEEKEPLRQSIGPALPPHLRKKLDDSPETQPSTSSGGARNSATIGPVLPPHLQHLADRAEEAASECSSSESSVDDGDQIGPSVGLQGGAYDVRKEFAERERRAEASAEAVPERESWMTELPSDRTGVKIGLGARMFTKREGTDVVLDDSWTATPGREKQTPKSDKKADQLNLAQRKRDAEIDEQLAEFNAAKRSKPLIDMHKDETARRAKKKEKKDKKQKKKKSKDKKHKKAKKKKNKDHSSDDEAPPARKPFNWEEDMRVSMVDTTRAKSMMDKTLLQSRFASSKSQKYL